METSLWFLSLRELNPSLSHEKYKESDSNTDFESASLFSVAVPAFYLQVELHSLQSRSQLQLFMRSHGFSKGGVVSAMPVEGEGEVGGKRGQHGTFTTLDLRLAVTFIQYVCMYIGTFSSSSRL